MSSPARAAGRSATRVLRSSSTPSCGTASRTACRRFHSHDHPAPAGPFTPVESAILAASYRHVPEHGFTSRALGVGAREAGFLDISPSVLPDGAFSLIKWHLATQRERLEGRTKALREDAGRSVEGKVEALTWERLLGNRDVIHRWQEALAIMAQPSYIPPSLRELSLLSDEILHLAGDISVDPSWYTKRASLSMIYTSAELFMTNDASPGFVETEEFLSRRLEEVKSLGGAVGAVGQWVGFTMGAGVNILRSKGVRI